MARALALCADLMFGSRMQADLAAAGHTLELIADGRRLRERLAEDVEGGGRVDVAIFDLTDERLDGAAVLEALRGEGAIGSIPTLAFYAHVDADVRERARLARFDLVVPRSRMAREGAALVGRLASDTPPGSE